MTIWLTMLIVSGVLLSAGFIVLPSGIKPPQLDQLKRYKIGRVLFSAGVILLLVSLAGIVGTYD